MLPACIAQFFASSVSLITSGLASAAPGRTTSPSKTLHPDVLVGAISFLLLRVGSGAHSLRAPAPIRCRDAPFLASRSDFIPARKKMHPSRGTFRPPAGGVPKPNNRAPALYQKGASHPRARPPRDRAKLPAPSCAIHRRRSHGAPRAQDLLGNRDQGAAAAGAPPLVLRRRLDPPQVPHRGVEGHADGGQHRRSSRGGGLASPGSDGLVCEIGRAHV